MMKTIDEVIERFEDDLHATDADSQLIMLFDRDVVDAIHYLKDYRMLINDIAEKRQELEDEKARYQEAVRNCEEAENKFRKMEDELNDIRREHIEQMKNPSLTWVELRTMEGKPVWYEHEFWKGWIILGKVEQGVNCEMIPDREERWYIVKDGIAKAYRKERE